MRRWQEIAWRVSDRPDQFGVSAPAGEGSRKSLESVVLQTGMSALSDPQRSRVVDPPPVYIHRAEHLLRMAHEEWEVIDNVPRIRLEKEPQGRLRWLTQEKITRLLDAAGKSRNKELRAAVIVALNTGLRRGELLGLAWERVDLSRGVIRLFPARGSSSDRVLAEQVRVVERLQELQTVHRRVQRQVVDHPQVLH